jgi:hypothetical protein
MVMKRGYVEIGSRQHSAITIVISLPFIDVYAEDK